MSLNKLTKIGEQAVFRTIPLFNLLSLDTYDDTIVGITGTRTVSKRMRFSIDGVMFTDWKLMTSPDDDIAVVNDYLDAKHPLLLEVMYERTGTDATGEIEIQSIEIDGTYDQPSAQQSVAANTVLKDFVGDNIDVYNLTVNLTKKIYETGIVPVYVVRGEEADDITTDRDYVDMWRTIAKMFAVLFNYGLKFTMVYWRRELLLEYLKQRTLIFCKDVDLPILQQVAQRYYDEIRNRGTIEVFRPAGYEYPMGLRTSYELDTATSTFELSPANPLWIDGIKYVELDELPFGWQIVDNNVIAPDVNYYKIEIVDNSSLSGTTIDDDFDYSVIDALPKILPVSESSVNPTHESGITKDFDGEYLRLICYNKDCDEFIFHLIDKYNRGFVVDRSSPMYRGLRHHENSSIIKGYENFAREVWDLDYYPIIGSGVALETFLIKHDDTDILQHSDNNSLKYQ